MFGKKNDPPIALGQPSTFQTQLAVPDMARLLEEKQKNESFKTLFPHWLELEKKIGLVTILHGRAPDMYVNLAAKIQLEGLLAISESRKFHWAKIQPVDYLEVRAVSLQGTGRKQAVEIARSAPIAAPPTLTERMFGRRR